MSKSAAKTQPTKQDVLAFLDKWVDSDQKRQDSLMLINIMERVSGEKATMWGPSIIGFGSVATPTGSWPAIAFSPRKTALTLYVVSNADTYADEIVALGKVKVSKACIYIKRLADVDMGRLEALIRAGYGEATR